MCSSRLIRSTHRLQDAEGSQLAAVMRRTPGAAEDFAKRHGVPSWYEDAEALVASEHVNAIYVASPPGAHLEHAKLACDSKKPTYIEKPLGRNVAETKAIVDMFEAANVPLFVAYYRRGLAPFTVARELISNGSIGVPVSVSFRLDQRPNAAVAGAWRIAPAESGGGLFCDTGVHVLDTIEYVMGEPLVDVSGSAANLGSPWQDVEDTVSMSFSFERSGARGVGLWSFCAPTNSESLVIDCSKGRISLVVSAMKGEIQRVNENGELGPATPLESRGDIANVQRESFVLVLALTRRLCRPAAIALSSWQYRQHLLSCKTNAGGVQQGLVQQIVDEIRGVDGAVSPSKGDNALRVAAVVDTVLGNYYGGREDNFWEREPSTYPGKLRSAATL